jgi:hypothetical protein
VIGAKTGFEIVLLSKVPMKMVPYETDKPRKGQRPLLCRSNSVGPRPSST